MRPTTYLVGFLAAASAALAALDISGLPREIQECMPTNYHNGWVWWGEHQWEKMTTKEFCRIDNGFAHPTATSVWWTHGVFTCVCKNNKFSWMENRMIKGKWATWMDEHCGGHDIGESGGQGKMCKKQP